jgi:hypothetical protein
MKKVFTSVLIASLLLISLTVGGCTSQKGFAIYLTRQDTPVSAMPALSHVELADEPIISIDDIISYTEETHEIELTADAYERVTKLEVPTSGMAFIVCINRQPIYWGAFWTPISSQSFDGVTIMLPPFPSGEHLIQIELGYPSPGFYGGEDPRSSPEILQSLEQAGKLK